MYENFVGVLLGAVLLGYLWLVMHWNLLQKKVDKAAEKAKKAKVKAQSLFRVRSTVYVVVPAREQKVQHHKVGLGGRPAPVETFAHVKTPAVKWEVRDKGFLVFCAEDLSRWNARFQAWRNHGKPQPKGQQSQGKGQPQKGQQPQKQGK